MRNVFFGILPLLVSVNSQVLVDNGVCYHIDNGVRVFEDCPPGVLPSSPQLPSTTDDNPTGHEANSSSTSSTSSTSRSSPTSTHSSDSVSSDAIKMFGGMALGSVIFGFVFLF